MWYSAHLCVGRLPTRLWEFAMFGSIVLLAASLAQPQPSSDTPTSVPIMVEGRDPRQTATDYVDRLLPPTGREAQFGRFEEPLCPKAIGLADDLAAQVADRIRQVARATNIQVAGGRCTPN